METNRPNIVLINCDDMGYGDLGCYGSKINHTPFLDELARTGMRFTSCYASSPVCSPSRAAMMTGCYPPRIGVTRVLFPGEPEGLSGEEYTMADLLRDNGYSTMIVGKWHCGDQPEFLPCQHGFDHYYGLPYSNDMGLQAGSDCQVPLPLLADNDVIQEQPDQRGLTERYTERCVAFIRQNKDRPFFLYFAQMHVHLPLYAAERFTRESENGDFGACMGEVDWACAAITDELKRQGVYENTLILFTSDNGSRGDHGACNAPLRGTKFTTWEGGQRVPLIAHWAGHIPAGTVNDNIICNIDFLPTFAALSGGRLPEKPIDGVNQLGTLLDPGCKVRDNMVYFGQNDHGSDLNAYRKGDWKLHFRVRNTDSSQKLECQYTEGYRLYNLKTDISESRDVAAEHPEIVKELAAEAEIWREKLGDLASGRQGSQCRPVGCVDHPSPLTGYDENHPYIVALYDKNDRG